MRREAFVIGPDLGAGAVRATIADAGVTPPAAPSPSASR